MSTLPLNFQSCAVSLFFSSFALNNQDFQGIVLLSLVVSLVASQRLSIFVQVYIDIMAEFKRSKHDVLRNEEKEGRSPAGNVGGRGCILGAGSCSWLLGSVNASPPHPCLSLYVEA